MMFNPRRLTMNRFTFSAFLVEVGLAGIFQNANAQAINATVQTVAPRVVTTRNAPAAKPIANAPMLPRVAPMATTINPRVVNSFAPYVMAHPPTNPQRTYSPGVRTSNANLAVLNAQRGALGPQTITL